VGPPGGVAVPADFYPGKGLGAGIKRPNKNGVWTLSFGKKPVFKKGILPNLKRSVVWDQLAYFSQKTGAQRGGWGI